ncbi:MAG: hypothetical protein K6B68_10725 [Eubacterium sp.]|nr:hypothetical protein [Eubacterium sp.]
MNKAYRDVIFELNKKIKSLSSKKNDLEEQIANLGNQNNTRDANTKKADLKKTIAEELLLNEDFYNRIFNKFEKGLCRFFI